MADEEHRVERIVECPHRRGSAAWLPAHDVDLGIDLVEHEVAQHLDAVVLLHDELGRTRGPRTGDRGVDVRRHPAPRPLVVLTARRDVRPSRDPADAFHVHRDEDPHADDATRAWTSFARCDYLPVVADDPFHAIVQSLDFPMLVVTTAAGGERSGCLVGFHTQCSIEPRRWLVCISVVNHTYRVVQGAQTLVMHFLREDQLELAQVFGAETGDAVDKFAQCAWHDGPDGVPVLDGCDWIAGRIIGRLDLGDHEGQLVDFVAAGRDHPGGRQLGFERVEWLAPGHPA